MPKGQSAKGEDNGARSDILAPFLFGLWRKSLICELWSQVNTVRYFAPGTLALALGPHADTFFA